MLIHLRKPRIVDGRVFVEAGAYPVIRKIKGLGYSIKLDKSKKDKSITIIRFTDDYAVI